MTHCRLERAPFQKPPDIGPPFAAVYNVLMQFLRSVPNLSRVSSAHSNANSAGSQHITYGFCQCINLRQTAFGSSFWSDEEAERDQITIPELGLVPQMASWRGMLSFCCFVAVITGFTDGVNVSRGQVWSNREGLRGVKWGHTHRWLNSGWCHWAKPRWQFGKKGFGSIKHTRILVVFADRKLTGF